MSSSDNTKWRRWWFYLLDALALALIVFGLAFLAGYFDWKLTLSDTMKGGMLALVGSLNA